MEKKQIWMKTHKIVIILICCVISLLPVALYVLKFRDYSISDDPTDWGAFGDYIGGIYGGVFSCLVVILAIFLTRALEHKDERKEKTSKAAEKLVKLIADVENNNNKRVKLSNINKLRYCIDENWLYIRDVKDDLIKLCDNFQMDNDDSGFDDIEFKERVLKRLAEMYDE